MRPKDFYFAQILRQKEAGQSDFITRLILSPDSLDTCSAGETKTVLNWAVENLLHEKVYSVESWLEVAYHLCKQRWDQSIDWLEEQPMSKIQAMISIVKKHAEEQDKQVKKASRRR